MDDLRLGTLLQRARLLSAEDLSHCLELQAAEEPRPPLGQLLLELNLIDGATLSHLLRMQASRLSYRVPAELPSNDVDVILRGMEQLRASQVLLTAGQRPKFRIGGALAIVSDCVVCDRDIAALVYATVPQEAAAAFCLGRNIEITSQLPQLGNARIAAFHHAAGRAISLQLQPPPLDQEILRATPAAFAGMVAGAPNISFVGAHSAALVHEVLEALVQQHIESSRMVVIVGDDMTRERGIADRSTSNALIIRRRVCHEVRGFEQALQHALEDPPDVLVVTDAESLAVQRLCLALHSHGTTVLAGVHGLSAPETLMRLVRAFDSNQERQHLAKATAAICCYASVTDASGPGSSIASDCLVLTDDLRSILLDRDDPSKSAKRLRAARVKSVATELAKRVQEGRIRYEDAFAATDDIHELMRASSVSRQPSP